MKTIIKNRGQLSFLKKPIENLERSHKPVPNAEVLRLYRDVLVMTRRFTWANDDGEPSDKLLRKTARTEFEELRKETDSLKLAQFMITWRDAVARIHEKVNNAELSMMNHVDSSRIDRQKMEKNDYISNNNGDILKPKV